MELRLFGPVSVQLDDRAVAIAGAQSARVIRALAVAPRAPLPAAVLVDAVWSGAPPANPAKALQTIVMRL